MKKIYMILPLVLILCFMIGCQDKEAMAELEAMKAQAEVEEQNKALVRRSMELYDEGNFVERDKMFSPNAVIHAPGGEGYSIKEYRERFGSKFYTAFPDLKHTIEDIIAEGDKVVLRLTDYGTHKEELMGIPPTEKEIHWPVISIYRLSNGIVEEVWVELDVLSLMQQLGMELKPKEETETHKEASPGEHAREGQDEHSEEGRGEHSGEGEETGQTFTLNETYDNIRKGVRLILSYDKASSSFIGTVENVTNRTIKSVRVEVHLSNGMELGPTSPIDLAPGKKTSVKLSAAGQSFNWWKAHPEAGSGKHSGEG